MTTAAFGFDVVALFEDSFDGSGTLVGHVSDSGHEWGDLQLNPDYNGSGTGEYDNTLGRSKFALDAGGLRATGSKAGNDNKLAMTHALVDIAGDVVGMEITVNFDLLSEAYLWIEPTPNFAQTFGDGRTSFHIASDGVGIQTPSYGDYVPFLAGAIGGTHTLMAQLVAGTYSLSLDDEPQGTLLAVSGFGPAGKPALFINQAAAGAPAVLYLRVGSGPVGGGGGGGGPPGSPAVPYKFKPAAAGYAIGAPDGVELTTVSGGMPRVAQGWSHGKQQVQLSKVMTTYEFQTWTVWLHKIIENGAIPFYIPLDTGLGLKWHRALLVPGSYAAVPLAGRRVWSVTFTVLVASSAYALGAAGAQAVLDQWESDHAAGPPP